MLTKKVEEAIEHAKYIRETIVQIAKIEGKSAGRMEQMNMTLVIVNLIYLTMNKVLVITQHLTM